jgi:hypothetical protein
MVFMLPRYYNQPYAASLHKSFNDNYDEVFRVDRHHKPIIPEIPGSEQANRTAIALPLFTAELPELVDQYAKAFEKVWAHRKELGNV